MFKETCKKTVSVSTLCFILDVHNICMQLFFRCSMLTVIQKPKVPMLLFGTPFSNFKTQTLQRNCFFAYYVEQTLLSLKFTNDYYQRRRENISCYGRPHFGDERKNCLQRQLFYFDESVSEYKYILKHFCFEDKLTRLKCFSVDLNRIDVDCIIFQKI